MPVAVLYSRGLAALEAPLVTVEVHLANGLPMFNLVGLPSYPSAYDKFLLAVSLVFNGVTVWTAWNWT